MRIEKLAPLSLDGTQQYYFKISSDMKKCIKKCIQKNDMNQFNELFLNLNHQEQLAVIKFCAASGYLEMFKCAIGINDLNLHIDDDILFKICIVHNQQQILEYLLLNGFTIDTADNYAIKICASYNGNMQLLQFIIDNGADIHANNDYPIMVAVTNRILPNTIFLIENGANIHASNDYPLRCAVFHGNYELIKYLLDNGANVHADNDFALKVICCKGYGDMDCVHLLLEAGANINLFTMDDLLDILTERNSEIIQTLIDTGVDFSIVNNYQNTIINTKETINLLVKQGLDPTQLALILYTRLPETDY